MTDQLKTILTTLRNEVLEEAAKVADKRYEASQFYPSAQLAAGMMKASATIAAAIRAKKEQTDE